MYLGSNNNKVWELNPLSAIYIYIYTLWIINELEKSQKRSMAGFEPRTSCLRSGNVTVGPTCCIWEELSLVWLLFARPSNSGRAKRVNSHCYPFPVPNARGPLVTHFDSLMQKWLKHGRFWWGSNMLPMYAKVLLKFQALTRTLSEILCPQNRLTVLAICITWLSCDIISLLSD